ncbi:hypothetical protein WAI453_010559 [Rhynchosporium graminicola]
MSMWVLLEGFGIFASDFGPGKLAMGKCRVSLEICLHDFLASEIVGDRSLKEKPRASSSSINPTQISPCVRSKAQRRESSKSKFVLKSLPRGGSRGVTAEGNVRYSCDAIYRTPIKKNRKNRETYYYPSETESGSYCTGINWETGDAITCWKNARSFVVRTPERKSSDDGKHQIATNGVPIRTPVRIPGKERDMLRVSFLTYKPSEGEEIMYEVDDKGRYTGNDQALFEKRAGRSHPRALCL